jgi:hypothetical protein
MQEHVAVSPSQFLQDGAVVVLRGGSVAAAELCRPRHHLRRGGTSIRVINYYGLKMEY